MHTELTRKHNKIICRVYCTFPWLWYWNIIVGFVAAAVSMPMGGCRARRPELSVAVVAVDVVIAVRLAVL